MTNLEYLKVILTDQKLLSENIKAFAAIPESDESEAYRASIERYHQLSKEYAALMVRIVSGEIDGKAEYQANLPG